MIPKFEVFFPFNLLTKMFFPFNLLQRLAFVCALETCIVYVTMLCRKHFMEEDYIHLTLFLHHILSFSGTYFSERVIQLNIRVHIFYAYFYIYSTFNNN